MLVVLISLPSCQRLDYENMHKAEKKWNPVDSKTQLEDLDFADDLVLLSHSHYRMREKTSELAAISSQVCLNIHKCKTKTLKVNAVSMEPVNL